VTVDYKWTPSVHTYAKVAKAYRAGGADSINYTFLSSSLATFKPEHLVSYELGLKSLWWDDRLRFNADVFEEKYRDIQLGFYGPNFQEFITANAGQATIKGAEGAVEFIPVDGLKLSAAFNYLSSNATQTNPFTLVTLVQELPNVPKWKTTVSAEYTFTRLSVGTLAALVSHDYHAKELWLPGDYRPAYSLVDARLTLSDIPVAQGDFSLALWGKNLTDKQYQVYHNYNDVVFGQPRSFGLSMNYNYR